MFLIGDLAYRTGLSTHAVNYYIKMGLIDVTTRAERSGYRLFDEAALEELQRIVSLRKSKVPIREILDRKSNGIL